MKVSARLHHHDYVRPQRRNGVRVILNHTGYCCFFCVFIFVAAVYTAVFVRVLSYQRCHHVTLLRLFRWDLNSEL